LIFEPEKYARHQATSAFDVDLEGRPLQKAAAGVEKNRRRLFTVGMIAALSPMSAAECMKADSDVVLLLIGDAFADDIR
jgi:hypothetical protein